MNAHTYALLSSALLLVPPAVAQRAHAPAALDSAEWRVPIHTSPADPTFGEYGLWAAGLGYKVSFHDGMTFYPVLGAGAPRNLPVGWTTEQVRIGTRELLGAGAPSRPAHDAWRFEYRFDGVSEIYDVRADGVEQTFVIARPAKVDGDLEVVGRWNSRLTPMLTPVEGSVSAAIAFVDDAAREVVRYGAAIAFDAAGRRVAVATHLDGELIRLTVPAAWIRSAAWPITIDPLLTSQTIAAPLSATIEESDVAVAFNGTVHRVMTTYSIPTSATDSDIYAVLTDENLQNPVLVFADSSAATRASHPRVAFVDQAGPTGRWAIAFERSVASGSEIRVWLHDGANTTFQSGSMMNLPRTAALWNDRRPDIGGSRGSPYALLTYENNLPVGGGVDDPTGAWTVFVDADARTFGAAIHVDSVPEFFDYANPTVTQTADGAPLSWIVCYQNRTAASDWRLEARRFSVGASPSSSALIVDGLAGEPGQKIEPSVDGNNTRYGVTYLLANSIAATSGTKLGMTRFMWPTASDVPTVNWHSIVDTTNPALFETLDDARVVVDVTIGHWAVAYRKGRLLGGSDRILAARVGFNGDVVETQSVHSALVDDGTAPSITYDFANSRYLLAYGADTSRSPVLGRVWTYPLDAVNVPYGVGCGGSFGAVSHPLVGTEFFRVRLTGAAANSPAVLWIGFQATVIDLDLVGMVGCDLLVNPAALVSLPATTDSAGNALVTIAFLLDPIDLYMQWAYIAIGANPLGVLTTHGLRSQVR